MHSSHEKRIKVSVQYHFLLKVKVIRVSIYQNVIPKIEKVIWFNYIHVISPQDFIFYLLIYKPVVKSAK